MGFTFLEDFSRYNNNVKVEWEEKGNEIFI